MSKWAKVKGNKTLYPLALLPSEGEEFDWHDDADQQRSSQVYCVSAFGTLRRLGSAEEIVNSFLNLPPTVTSASREKQWKIELEAVDETLLNERGKGKPTNIDVLLTNHDSVVCVEAKFLCDAHQGFGVCSQGTKRKCQKFYGPGSDLDTQTQAWCRLETWDGTRAPRLYWSLGRTYFNPEVFQRQTQVDTCPFRGPNFQLMRNFLFGASLKQRQRKERFAVVVVCPTATSAVIAKQVERFRSEILLPQFREHVVLRSYEDYVACLRQVGDDKAIRLADFLEERIATLIT